MSMLGPLYTIFFFFVIFYVLLSMSQYIMFKCLTYLYCIFCCLFALWPLDGYFISLCDPCIIYLKMAGQKLWCKSRETRLTTDNTGYIPLQPCWFHYTHLLGWCARLQLTVNHVEGNLKVICWNANISHMWSLAWFRLHDASSRLGEEMGDMALGMACSSGHPVLLQVIKRRGDYKSELKNDNFQLLVMLPPAPIQEGWAYSLSTYNYQPCAVPRKKKYNIGMNLSC